MYITCIPTVNAKPKNGYREQREQGVCWSLGFNFEVLQSTLRMFICPYVSLLAMSLGLLKVVCRAQWWQWFPLFWVLAILVFNPGALHYTFAPEISNPTTSQWAFDIVGLGVHVRSHFLGRWFLHQEYYQGLVHQVYCLSINDELNMYSFKMSIEPHIFRLNNEYSGQSQPAGVKIQLGKHSTFIETGW